MWLAYYWVALLPDRCTHALTACMGEWVSSCVQTVTGKQARQCTVSVNVCPTDVQKCVRLNKITCAHTHVIWAHGLPLPDPQSKAIWLASSSWIGLLAVGYWVSLADTANFRQRSWDAAWASSFPSRLLHHRIGKGRLLYGMEKKESQKVSMSSLVKMNHDTHKLLPLPKPFPEGEVIHWCVTQKLLTYISLETCKFNLYLH